MTVPTTRRGVLAGTAAGVAGLAGCSGLLGGNGGDGDGVELDGSALQSLAAEPVPDVARPTPVDVAPAHVEAGVERARTALSAVPDPLEPAEVPNGAVRERLAEHRTDATEALDRAADVPNPAAALGSVRAARREAAFVRAAYDSIRDDRGPGAALADVGEAVGPVRERLRTERERWTYVGTDPVAAVLVHADVERLFEDAGHELHDAEHLASEGRDHALTVGDAAGHLADGRASVGDAAHLFDRLGGDRPLRERFVDAASVLNERLTDQRADLPDPGATGEEPDGLVERDVEGTPAAWALEGLYRSVSSEGVRSVGDPVLARRVLDRYERLARARALATLRERIAGGETFVPSSATDVRARRAAAVDAIESARGSGPYPRLVAAALADLVGLVAYGDRGLERVGDTARVSHVDEEVGAYLHVEVVAGTLPAASRTLGDALTGS